MSLWLCLIKTKFNLHLTLAGLFGFVVIKRLVFIAGPNPNYKTRKGTAVVKFKWTQMFCEKLSEIKQWENSGGLIYCSSLKIVHRKI